MSKLSATEGRGGPLWANIIFMSVTPVLAAILVPLHIYYYGNSWGLWAMTAVFFTVNNMIITTGYHRHFSHLSYEAHPLVRAFYVIVGAGCFQGSVLQWCTDHRRHHRKVDGNEDPYSINKGFFYAHMGWMFSEDPHAGPYVKDLAANRLIQWQHDQYVWVASFMGFVMPGIVSWALGLGFWGGVIFPGLLRIVLSQHSTFLINSAAHCFGKQTYTDKHSARDSIIMAFLTFGEGYHNFHHSFQLDYRNGTRWYHWDPTKWAIRGMSFIGLATKLKEAPREEILKARLHMEERQLLQIGACATRSNQLKQQIFEAQTKLKALRASYLNAKRDLSLKSSDRFAEVKANMRVDIRAAKVEFKKAYSQWRAFRRQSKRVPAASSAVS
jgi:stearoyl-CoA desaturase (delta-9 desaturase)